MSNTITNRRGRNPSKQKWEIIEDKKVTHTWQCSHCGEIVDVWPDYYQESGTPVCADCDIDMDYIHTSILVDWK